MSIVLSNGAIIEEDVNILPPKMREVFNLLYQHGLPTLLSNRNLDSKSSLAQLRKLGYVEYNENLPITSQSKVKITDDGESILHASNRFWEILNKDNIKEAPKNSILPIKSQRHPILAKLLANLNTCKEEGVEYIGMTLEELEKGLQFMEYQKGTVGSMLSHMLRFEGTVEFDKGERKYLITSKGKTILAATNEFYEHLVESGFFDENSDENGPEKARDAFAEFDGGESRWERESGAAE